MKNHSESAKSVISKACSLGVAVAISCTMVAAPAWAYDGLGNQDDTVATADSVGEAIESGNDVVADDRDPMLISSLDPSKNIMSEDEWFATWQNYIRQRDTTDHAYYFALNSQYSTAYTNPEWKDNDSYCYIYNRDKSESLTNYGIAVYGNRGVYHEYPTDDWYNDSIGQYAILRTNGQFFITNNVNENGHNWAKLRAENIGTFHGYALGVWSADSVGSYPVLQNQPW